MRISPHLNFNGDCRAAFERYQAVFGGTIQVMLSYGESPMAPNYEARWHGRILHAALVVGEMEIIGTDLLPDDYHAPRGIFITVTLPTTAAGGTVFEGLAAGGSILLPFARTFWSAGFGVLVDPFGITWEINSDVTPS